MSALILIAGAFAAGAIPFGFIIGRVFFHCDLRKSGSGNIGAANALRTIGKGGAAAVLLLDALKGYAPAALGRNQFGYEIAAAAGIAAVLGHCYSPFLGWRGGKGVATSLGVIFALSKIAGLVCICGWLAGALGTGYSSVGSLALNLVAPFALLYFTGSPAAAAYGIFAALFVAYTHRANIARLRTGTENRLKTGSTLPGEQ